MTDPQTYHHADTYHAMLDRLEQIARNYDPAAPFDLRSQIIEALGEGGGVWPISCFTGED